MVESRVAIIPARGNSKRLPGKNIMEFFGKPMIAWAIESALVTKLFDVVLVSTDSEEIAELSRSYGAEVPFLRKAHADDFSPVSEATLTALNQLESYKGKAYTTVVQLMANCPMRNSKNIAEQLASFENQPNPNSLISGFSYGMFNPWWAHLKNEQGGYEKLLTQYDSNTRSQDLPALLCPTGATWISDAQRLKTHNTFYSPGYSFYEINWLEAVDIDDEDDLKLAKAAYLVRHGNV